MFKINQIGFGLMVYLLLHQFSIAMKNLESYIGAASKTKFLNSGRVVSQSSYGHHLVDRNFQSQRRIFYNETPRVMYNAHNHYLEDDAQYLGRSFDGKSFGGSFKTRTSSYQENHNFYYRQKTMQQNKSILDCKKYSINTQCEYQIAKIKKNNIYCLGSRLLIRSNISHDKARQGNYTVTALCRGQDFIINKIKCVEGFFDTYHLISGEGENIIQCLINSIGNINSFQEFSCGPMFVKKILLQNEIQNTYYKFDKNIKKVAFISLLECNRVYDGIACDYLINIVDESLIKDKIYHTNRLIIDIIQTINAEEERSTKNDQTEEVKYFCKLLKSRINMLGKVYNINQEVVEFFSKSLSVHCDEYLSTLLFILPCKGQGVEKLILAKGESISSYTSLGLILVVENVLHNLLNNAFKYKKNSVKVKVISLEHSIEIIVYDDGFVNPFPIASEVNLMRILYNHHGITGKSWHMGLSITKFLINHYKGMLEFKNANADNPKFGEKYARFKIDIEKSYGYCKGKGQRSKY